MEPLYAELNRRKAVVFIHPTSPSCPCCEVLSLGYPRPVMEFIFETKRSVVQMILSGVTTRYPDLRVIVPHAGAALPVIASRVVGAQAALPTPAEGQASPDLRVELRRLHYDLAGAPPWTGTPSGSFPG
jgi:6-methylsalicylate decarboxylase